MIYAVEVFWCPHQSILSHFSLEFFIKTCSSGESLNRSSPANNSWVISVSWPEFAAPRAAPGYRWLFSYLRRKCLCCLLSAASTMWSLLQGRTDERPFATGIPLGKDSSLTGEAAQKELDCIYWVALSPSIKPLVSLQGRAVARRDYLSRSGARCSMGC